MRRGYLEGVHTGPIRLLPIDYERHAEAHIASILSRLDELGDAVDGEITAGEIGEMLAMLAVLA